MRMMHQHEFASVHTSMFLLFWLRLEKTGLASMTQASSSAMLRNIVLLRYYFGLPAKEVGEVLKMSEGTVRYKAMMACRKLKPLLAQFYASPVDIDDDS